MATEVILPRVDMDMESGKFLDWLVKEGESVKKGQPLFEIETDKAAMEVEAPAAGILKGVTVSPGDVLPVGAIIAWIAAPDEAVVAAEPEQAAAPARIPAEASVAEMPAEKIVQPPSGAQATPLARRLAREAGLDLAFLSGTGPSGRIQARDVQALGASAAQPRASGLHSEWLVRGEATPIVLLHGFGADASGWRALVSRLGGKRPILALDLPGHGRSAETKATSFEVLVDLVEACVEAQGVQRGHWVAHSLGAAVAAHCAARHPTSVASLTLIAPAGLGPEINSVFVEGFLRARSPASLAPILRLLVEDEDALGGAMVQTTLRQREDRALVASQAALADLAFPDGVQAIDARAALSTYDGPTKVIAGRQDKIIPSRHAASLPGQVGVHLMRGVGHMPHLESRDLVARLVLDNVAAGERAV